MANSTAKSSQFFAKEQARPRHPYAFCQCEGPNCVECVREEKAQRQASSDKVFISLSDYRPVQLVELERIQARLKRSQLPLENCQSLISAAVRSAERNVEMAHSLSQRLRDSVLFSRWLWR